MGETEGKIHALKSEDNDQTSINDDSLEESINIQDQEAKSTNNNAAENNTVLTQKDVNATLKPLTNIIENISQLVGLEAPKKVQNGEDNDEENKVSERKRVLASDNKTKSDNKENKNEQSSKSSSNAKDSAKEKASSSGGGLNLSNLNNAATKFSDDPVVALKEKAKELGRQMGLKAGNEQGQGKISGQDNEAKFNAFLAQSGSTNPLPQSTAAPTPTTAVEGSAQSDNSTTAAPVAASTPAPADTAAPVAAPAASTAPATTTATSTASTEQKQGEKDNKEQGPALTPEQAAEHITTEFKIGYNQGFNDGYTEGANAQIALNSPEVKAAKLKETPAYKDGVLAGQAKMTAAGKETEDRIAAFEDKYCKPFRDAKAAQTSNPSAPAPTQEQEDNNIAFNQGFNDGYTQGGNETIKAEEQKKLAEKENPEYIEGAKLATKSIEDPSSTAANEASLKGKSDIFKRGYYQGFNDQYTTKGNEAIMKERNAFTDAGLSTGEYKEFYKKGQELGAEFGANPPKDKINAILSPLYNDFIKEKNALSPLSKEETTKEKNNTTAAFNIGIEKSFIAQHKANQEAEKSKAKQSVLFQKAYAVGQVIGMLKVKGGDALLKQYADKLGAFFKEKNFDLGNKEAASLETIKAFLIKESIGQIPPATIKKDKKDVENPEYQEFNVGYNQGWDDGYKNDGIKSSGSAKNDKATNDIDQSEEYKNGYKDGISVGKISAETDKKVASPADKQAFDAEIQNLTKQAEAKGADFYRGFNNGMNDGYIATLNGAELNENPLDNASQKTSDVINKYKKLGDTDMVERLEKLYQETYKEIEEEIYTAITKSIQASGNENESQSLTKDQFDTIPSDADLDKMQVDMLNTKLGARGSLSDAYDGELADVESQLSQQNISAEEKAKLQKVKDAIATEVHDSCKVYKEAYISAATAAKDRGYSYVTGYTEQMKILEGPKVEITIGKIKNFSNKEYKKGVAAADSFGAAIRTNKMLDANPDSKYISAESRPKMPKRVVSKGYKEGYEEAFLKWSIVEYTILGIAIPDKFTNDPIYNELKQKDESKVAEDGTTVVDKKAKRNKSLYALPKNQDEANVLNSKKSTIKTDDIKLYKNKMLSGYYSDMVSYVNTYLLGLKDTGDIVTTKVSNTVKEIEGMNTVINKQDVKLDEVKAKLKPRIDEIASNFAANPKFKELVDKLYSLNNVQDFRDSFKSLIALSKSESEKLQTRMDKESENSSAKEKSIKSEDIDIEELNPNDILTKIKTLEANTFLKEGHLLYKKDNPFTILINNVDTSEKEYSKGYIDAINKVDNSESLSESTNEDMSKYLEKIGYAQGFVQKVANLGLEKDSKEKALKVIAEYLKLADFDFPQKSEIGLKKEYTDIKEFKITPSEVLNDRIAKDADLKIQVNQFLKTGKTKGEAAAELSFNLSSKDFTYVNNTEFKKENASALAAGPLGQKAVLLFEAILKEVNKLTAFIDIQKQLELLSAAYNKNKSNFSNNLTSQKQYIDFNKLLFGKTINGNINDDKLKITNLPSKQYKESKSLDNNIDFSKVENLSIDLQMEKLNLEGKGNIVSILGTTNGQLGLTGSGLRLISKSNNISISQAKFIIPSLEKGLIAKNKDGQDIKSKNQDLIKEKLQISNGKINIKPNELKSSLQNAQNKIIDILNKEEMANQEANKTSNK